MGRKTKLKPVFRVKIKGDPTDRTVLLRRGDFAVDPTTGQLSASYAPVVSDEMDLADHENDPHLAARRFVELLAGIKEPETAHKTFPGFNVTVVGQDSQVTQTVVDMGPLDATQLKKITDTLAKGDNGAKHEVVEQDVATGDVALPTALQQQLAKSEQVFLQRQCDHLQRLDKMRQAVRPGMNVAVLAMQHFASTAYGTTTPAITTDPYQASGGPVVADLVDARGKPQQLQAQAYKLMHFVIEQRYERDQLAALTTKNPQQQAQLEVLERVLQPINKLYPSPPAGLPNWDTMDLATAQALTDVYNAYQQEAQHYQQQQQTYDNEVSHSCLYRFLQPYHDAQATIKRLTTSPPPLSSTDQQSLANAEAVVKDFPHEYAQRSRHLVALAQLVRNNANEPPTTAPPRLLTTAEQARLASLKRLQPRQDSLDDVELTLLECANTNTGFSGAHPAFVKLLEQLEKEASDPNSNPFLAAAAQEELNPSMPPIGAPQNQVKLTQGDDDAHLHARGVRGAPAQQHAALDQCVKLDAAGLPDGTPAKPAPPSDAFDYWESHQQLWDKHFSRYRAHARARAARLQPGGHVDLSIADIDDKQLHHQLNAAFSLDEPIGTAQEQAERVRVVRRRAHAQLDEHRARLRNEVFKAASFSPLRVHRSLAQLNQPGQAVIFDMSGATGWSNATVWPVDPKTKQPLTFARVLNLSSPSTPTAVKCLEQAISALTGDPDFAADFCSGMDDASAAAFMGGPVAEVVQNIQQHYWQANTPPLDQIGVGQPYSPQVCAQWEHWLQHFTPPVTMAPVTLADIQGELMAIDGDSGLSSMKGGMAPGLAKGSQMPADQIDAFKAACHAMFPTGQSSAAHQQHLAHLRYHVTTQAAANGVDQLKKAGNLGKFDKVEDVKELAERIVVHYGGTARAKAHGFDVSSIPPYSETSQMRELQRRETVKLARRYDRQHVQPVRRELSGLQTLMRKAPEALLRELRDLGVVTLPDVSRNPAVRCQQLRELTNTLNQLDQALAQLEARHAYGNPPANVAAQDYQQHLKTWRDEVRREIKRLQGESVITTAQRHGTLPSDLVACEELLLDLVKDQLATECAARFQRASLGVLRQNLSDAIEDRNNFDDASPSGVSVARLSASPLPSGLGAGSVVYQLAAASLNDTVQVCTKSEFTPLTDITDLTEGTCGKLNQLKDEIAAARQNLERVRQAFLDKRQEYDRSYQDLSASLNRQQAIVSNHEQGIIAQLQQPIAALRQEIESYPPGDLLIPGAQRRLREAERALDEARNDPAYLQAQQRIGELSGEAQVCRDRFQEVQLAFKTRYNSEMRHLNRLEGVVNRALSSQQVYDYDALSQTKVAADAGNPQVCATLLASAMTSSTAKPNAMQMELARRYGRMRQVEVTLDNHRQLLQRQQAMSAPPTVTQATSQKIADLERESAFLKADYYNLQAECDNVDEEVDQLQSKVDSFLDRQQELLKDEDAAKKMAKQARAKRKKAIMEALDLKAIGREDDLLRAVTKAHSGYFTSPKQALKQCKNMLLGAGSRQHVSVDLQSALPLIFLRALIAIFLLLFAGFMAVKNKIHDAAGREKTQNQALERLVAYHIKANDGKLDLDALKRDLLSGAEDNALWANGDGKTKKDLEEQMHIIQLKAARYAYAMGVEPEDIKGWQNIKHKDGIGRKFSDAHKFEAFLDDQDASHTQSSYTHSVADYQQWTDEYQSTMQGKQTQQLKASNQRAPVLTSPSTCRTPNYLSHGAKKGPSTGGGMPSLPPGIATH